MAPGIIQNGLFRQTKKGIQGGPGEGIRRAIENRGLVEKYEAYVIRKWSLVTGRQRSDVESNLMYYMIAKFLLYKERRS